MQLIRYLANNFYEPHVVSIGNFDGVHLGHQKIINSVVTKAQQLKLPSLLVIFEPQPLEYLLANNADSRLTTLGEKLAIFKQFALNKVVCLKFDEKLANLTAQQFIEKILMQNLKTKYLIIGDDFSFGKNRTGGLELLQTYNTFITEQLPTLYLKQHRISSSHVRQALVANDFALASQMLGREYTMGGHVAHGNKLGRKLGFPTANIFLHHKVLSLTGVFAVRIHGLKSQPLVGIANIGKRPTVDGTRNMLEVHIFNFNQDIYEKKIAVTFIHKIRNETKFTALNKLQQQISNDIEQAKKIFGL